MKAELRLTDTNAASDSKGRTWGLEGGLFWWLVGGIGVMNIMLVSVTERTREIGIRMATGARTRNILQQFLVEAVIVSALGGLIGVGIGIVSALIIGAFGMSIQFSIPTIILAFTCAAAVGLIFGLMPAVKAEKRPALSIVPAPVVELEREPVELGPAGLPRGGRRLQRLAHQAGRGDELLCVRPRAGLTVDQTEGVHPGRQHTHQQQQQENERTPEQAQRNSFAGHRGRWRDGRGKRLAPWAGQDVPSGTNT